jgi:hypothetical protein
MRFFFAKGAPQNDGGFWWGGDLRWRFAPDDAEGLGCFGKAAAEPPHSTMGGAGWALRTLRETAAAWAARFASPRLG